jgi:hypothetical protein
VQHRGQLVERERFVGGCPCARAHDCQTLLQRGHRRVGTARAALERRQVIEILAQLRTLRRPGDGGRAFGHRHRLVVPAQAREQHGRVVHVAMQPQVLGADQRRAPLEGQQQQQQRLGWRSPAVRPACQVRRATAWAAIAGAPPSSYLIAQRDTRAGGAWRAGARVRFCRSPARRLRYHPPTANLEQFDRLM